MNPLIINLCFGILSLFTRRVSAQIYAVSDAYCPPIPMASNSYLISVTMSPTGNSVPCDLFLQPATTAGNLYAQVRITEKNCASRLLRPIVIRSKTESYDFTCENDRLFKTYSLGSSDKLTIRFPATSYNYKLQLWIVVVFFQRSSTCSASEFSCTALTTSQCISPSKLCDGKQDCSNNMDEPAFCKSPRSQGGVTTSPANSTSDIFETVTKWFQENAWFRISVIVGVAVFVLIVLPTIVFCCCGKKSRKASARPSRRSRTRRSRSRSRELEDAVAHSNGSRRNRALAASRSGGSGAASQSGRYDPLRSEPSAPPPPLSVPPTPQMVLVPAGQLLPASAAAQPIYALPYTQTGGQPAFFGQPLASVSGSGERPQYVAAYMLPASAVAQAQPAGMPLILNTNAAQPFMAQQLQSAPNSAPMLRDACPPPSYDEAIRTASPPPNVTGNTSQVATTSAMDSCANTNSHNKPDDRTGANQLQNDGSSGSSDHDSNSELHEQTN